MSNRARVIFALILALGLELGGAGAASATCSGRFMNPLTDICWRCVFPLRIGSHVVWRDPYEPGNEPYNDLPLTCTCGNTVGLGTEMWEPSHQVDISSDPYCMPSLGGISMNPVGLPGDVTGMVAMKSGKPGQQNSFYHYIAYRNPIMVAMQFMSDNPCLEHKPFDALDFSAANPAWGDDQLAAILNPDAFLYGNLAAVLIGIPHGVCSTLGTGDPACTTLRMLAHWSVGFNGTTYPLTGSNDTDVSPISTSMNIAKRAFTVQHRTFRVWGTSGLDGMCGYYPQPFMDDNDYKLSMTYPLPETEPIAGRCCQAFGASTMVWGAGHTWPVTGEDMSYVVFKRRDCCMGVVPLDQAF